MRTLSIKISSISRCRLDIPQIYEMYLQPPRHNNEQVAINWIIDICSQLSSN